jgi:hypothetical protein
MTTQKITMVQEKTITMVQKQPISMSNSFGK